MKKKNTKSNKRQHPSKQGLVKTQLITIPSEQVISKIFLIRGKKVMMDKDLALLYGVETKSLNRAVRRNIERFPIDFMFQLNDEEAKRLVSQNVIPSKKHLGGFLPHVFTEQGVTMLSSILNSERAILVNIQIIRTFTKLRELIATNTKLRQKIEAMEQKYDIKFKKVFDVLKQLLMQENKSKNKISF
jgi:hypothetical protein